MPTIIPLRSPASLQKNNGTSNYELQNLMNLFLKQSKNKPKLFKGVYACNQIPKYLQNVNNFSIIVNIAGSSSSEGHWVSLARNHGKAYYFDSYGASCFNWYILAFISKLNVDLIENYRMIQSFDSAACGYFSLLFVLLYEEKKTLLFSPKSTTNHMRRFTFNFGKLNRNDLICIKIIKKKLEEHGYKCQIL